MNSNGFKSTHNTRLNLRNNMDDFAATLARKVATINPNKESSSLINGKRKVLDSVENSKTITKIREWDLPKLEQNNHEPYSQTIRHKKRKSTNNYDDKQVKIESSIEPTNNNDPITPPPVAAATKTIDDLFKKTDAKPSIYWAPKEKYLTQTQIIENIVADLVDSIVASMETVDQVVTIKNEPSHSNENETTKSKASALNLSDLISNNIKSSDINMNCFDNGTLIAVHYENKQVVCSIIDQVKLEIKKSIKIPVLNSEYNLNLRKYKNLIYLSFNTQNGSVIKIVDDNLNILDEIIFSQGVSRLLGINDSFIYFKPELSNIKLESRIYIYDRKLKTKKAVGQCNSPLRPFFFSKSTVQLESLNNKFICLDSDDTFKIIDELSGIVLYSIRLKGAKQFLVSSQQQIVLLTDKTLTYFTLDGYLDKQTTLDGKIFEESICFFNDSHDNIYLFERNQFILHKF